MKQLFLAIVAVGILLSSCKKESIEIIQQENPIQITTRASDWGLHRKWWFLPEECVPEPPYTCFDDIVIKPDKRDAYNLFVNYVNKNESDKYFRHEEWQILFPDLVNFPDYLTKLKGEVMLRSVNGKTVYLGYNKDNEFEFALSCILEK